jgi:hypothetical protein
MVTSCKVAKGKLTLNRKPRKPRKPKPELPLSFPKASLTNQLLGLRIKNCSARNHATMVRIYVVWYTGTAWRRKVGSGVLRHDSTGLNGPPNDVLSGGMWESGLLPEMAHDRPATTKPPLHLSPLNCNNAHLIFYRNSRLFHCKSQTLSIQDIRSTAAVIEDRVYIFFW